MKDNDRKENLGFKGIGRKVQQSLLPEPDHAIAPELPPPSASSVSIAKEVERIRKNAEAAVAREKAEKENKARQNAHTQGTAVAEEREKREQCKDGSCIGIIGPDGRCTECGKTPAEVHERGLETKQQPVSERSNKKPWVIAAVVLCAIFVIAFATFEPQPPSNPSLSSQPLEPWSPSPATPAPAPVSKPKKRDARMSLPEQPLPHSGSIRTFTKRERVAPFEIKASQGSHYLLKLVDANTYDPVLTIFVRSGTTVNVDVPLGTYELRYASGERWYGYEYLFGPETAYSQADKTFSFGIVGNQISGFTITLYRVAHGNLHMSKIAPKDF